MTSWPRTAASRAIASPTTPAPITRTCISTLANHIDAIAGRDLSGRDHLGIDAAIGVIEILHQRMHDRQVADSGAGLDLGRGATPDALHDLEPRLRTDREGTAEQIEFAPRRPAFDMEVGAKPQGIDRGADRALDGRDRGKIDDRDDFPGDIRETVSRAMQDLGRSAQLVGAETGEEILDRGASRRRAQIAARG